MVANGLALTPRQQAMLDFIRQFIAKHHYAPTYEEIRVGMNLSTKSLVDYHLTKIEAAGYIGLEPHKARAIYLLAQD